MGTQLISLASLIFPNNEQQITDGYSEPCQTAKLESLTRKLKAFSH